MYTLRRPVFEAEEVEHDGAVEEGWSADGNLGVEFEWTWGRFHGSVERRAAVRATWMVWWEVVRVGEADERWSVREGAVGSIV